jgi:Fructose-bisphosphate aldolase class-II
VRRRGGAPQHGRISPRKRRIPTPFRYCSSRLSPHLVAVSSKGQCRLSTPRLRPCPEPGRPSDNLDDPSPLDGSDSRDPASRPAGARGSPTRRPLPYVFHGSSGSSAQENAKTVTYGVVKVNVDTDNQYALTRAFTGHVFDHWRGCSRSTVDGQRAQLRPVGVGRRRGGDGRARWQAREQLGSAGRSLAASAPASDRAATPLIDLD